jgi:lipoyl(octanoyl) transferase
VISVIQLGVVPYQEGLDLQRRLVELRKSGEIGDTLLLLEHSPVITLGRNARAANILASPEVLSARGVELFECDRGGDVTFHGPGQIVGYPIFDLRGHELHSHDSQSLDNDLRSQKLAGEGARSTRTVRKTLGAVDFVRRLEEVLIRTCGDFGIPAKRLNGLTGAWTEREPSAKVAAIGVHISRSVTSHGFALNVNTDLSYFNLIIPCGITTHPVTSMQKELGRKLNLDEVSQTLSRNFGTVFSSQMLWLDSIYALLGNRVGVPLKLPSALRKIHGDDRTFFA